MALVAAGIAVGAYALGQGDSTSNGQGVTIDQARDIQASIAALPKCADLFKPGKKFDQKTAVDGCLDPDGGVQLSGSFRCNDGRHLWSVDAATGAPTGWGFSGDVYHASKTKEVAADPGYKKAYDACVS